MNRFSSTAIEGKTPLDIWPGGATQDYKLLRVFESPIYFSVIDDKLNPRAMKFVFLRVKNF